jgi:Flp pilus assembly protein TadG
MRLNCGRTRKKGARERGVAAVEFALILPFIAIIVLATIDYGYYFYIGVNATEAARAAGAQATSTAAAAGIATCGDANIGLVTNVPATSPAAAPTKAGVDYMTNNVSSAIGGDTTVTVGCTMVSAKPAWSIVVRVAFPPVSGTVHFGLPKSGSNLVYTTPTLWRR